MAIHRNLTQAAAGNPRPQTWYPRQPSKYPTRYVPTIHTVSTNSISYIRSTRRHFPSSSPPNHIRAAPRPGGPAGVSPHGRRDWGASRWQVAGNPPLASMREAIWGAGLPSPSKHSLHFNHSTVAMSRPVRSRCCFWPPVRAMQGW